ncbi:TetR/AcrR family transcriptional regulator [Rhodococcus triatomae]
MSNSVGTASPDRRAVILDAAVELMSTRGFHGTSIRDIATAVGITPASIYHHFRSKQEVLQFIVIQTHRAALNAAKAAVGSRDTPNEQLQALTRSWILFHLANDEALIAVTELRSLDRAAYELVSVMCEQQEAVFLDVIVRGIDLRAFKPPSLGVSTRAIVHMGRAVCLDRRPGSSTPDQLADNYSNLALRMVSACP